MMNYLAELILIWLKIDFHLAMQKCIFSALLGWVLSRVGNVLCAHMQSLHHCIELSNLQQIINPYQ